MKHRWKIEWHITEEKTGRELYYAMDIVPRLSEDEAYEYARTHVDLLYERVKLDWPNTNAALSWTALASDPHIIQMSGRKLFRPGR